MDKPFVYVTRKLPEEQLSPLKELADIEMWEKEDEPCPRDVLLEKAKTADGLLTMLSDRIDAELLQKAPRLKAVANLAVGFDNIDVEAKKKTGRDLPQYAGCIDGVDRRFNLCIVACGAQNH